MPNHLKKPLVITDAMREAAAAVIAPGNPRRQRLLVRTGLIDIVIDGIHAARQRAKRSRRLRPVELKNQRTAQRRRQVLEVAG